MIYENDTFYTESISYSDKVGSNFNWLTTYDSQFEILSPKLDYKDHLMEILVYSFIAGAVWNLFLN